MPIENIQPNRDDLPDDNLFLDEIAAILRGERPVTSGHITRLLRQFRLDRKGYTYHDVISEVYLRTLPKISSGTNIDHPTPWIKAVALNYIRELNRKHKRELRLEDESSIEAQPDCSDDNTFVNERIQHLKKALSKLKSLDCRIVHLYYLQNKSCKEVVKILQAEGTEITELALRKRAERIKHKLRGDMEAE